MPGILLYDPVARALIDLKGFGVQAVQLVIMCMAVMGMGFCTSQVEKDTTYDILVCDGVHITMSHTHTPRLVLSDSTSRAVPVLFCLCVVFCCSSCCTQGVLLTTRSIRPIFRTR